MTTETDTTKKKGASPSHEIFFMNEDGSVNYGSRIAIWTTKSGKAQNCTINGKRAVIFPVKPKAQPAAEEDGA